MADETPVTPTATPAAPAPQPDEGLLHELATSAGLDPEAIVATAKAIRQHPWQVAKEVGSAQAGEFVDAGHHLRDTALSALNGVASAITNPEAKATAIARLKSPGLINKIQGAEEYATAAVPLVGGNYVKAEEQAGRGNIAGSIGTTLGTTLPLVTDTEGAEGIKAHLAETGKTFVDSAKEGLQRSAVATAPEGSAEAGFAKIPGSKKIRGATPKPTEPVEPTEDKLAAVPGAKFVGKTPEPPAPAEPPATAAGEAPEYHPDLQKVIDLPGVKVHTDPKQVTEAAHFVTPDGKFVRLPAGLDHDAAINTVKPDQTEYDPRINFINDTGAMRIRPATDRAGQTLHVSVPEKGVTPEQADALKQAVGAGMKSRGNMILETAATPQDIRTTDQEMVSPRHIEPMLKSIEPPKVEPNTDLQASAQKYAKAQGMPEINHEPMQADAAHATEIAKTYDEAQHNPNDPKVKAAYDALKSETLQQFHHLQDDLGLKFEPQTEDPYKSAGEMMADVKNNKRLKVYSTADELPKDHPLSEIAPGTGGQTYNTVFRWVHDAMGHAAGGNDFSENGEKSATEAHAQMYSDAARPAMRAETEGQTSWFFHNPKIEAGEAQAGTFAPQKATILPDTQPQWHETAGKAAATDEAGGIDPHTGKSDTTGLGTEILPEARQPLDHAPTAKDFAKFYDQHKDLFDKHPELRIGWDNKSAAEGGHEINIGAVGPGAEAVARKLDQKSAVNIEKGEVIPTGGTGLKTKFPKSYPIEKRLADLKNPSPFAPSTGGTGEGPAVPTALATGGTGKGMLGELADALNDPDSNYQIAKTRPERVAEIRSRMDANSRKGKNIYEGLTTDEKNIIGFDNQNTMEKVRGMIAKGGGEFAGGPLADGRWNIQDPKTGQYITIDGNVTSAKVKEAISAVKIGQQMQNPNGSWSTIPDGSAGEGPAPKLSAKEQKAADKATAAAARQAAVFQPSTGGTPEAPAAPPAAPAASKDIPTVSTRVPTKKVKGEVVEDHTQRDMTSDMDAAKAAPGYLQKMVNRTNTTPGFTPPEGDALAHANAYIRHAADNIKFVLSKMLPEAIKRDEKWYPVGAHERVQAVAAQHGFTPHQIAGVTAVESPMTDWDQNTSLAERTANIWKNQQDTKFTPEMQDAADKITSLPVNSSFKPLIKKVQGKTLAELPTTEQQAIWLRLYDEGHNPREYQTWNPDGTSNGLALNQDGTPRSVGWSFQSHIQKAIEILKDGSPENISKNLGYGHKVRNFYNNMLSPDDPRYLTMDTHAINVAQLRPMSGKSPAVRDNFGNIKNGEYGLKGTYALHDAAYRLAAKELDIPIPSRLQSPTWTKIRDVFTDDFKTPENQQAIDAIWKEHSDGKITADQARNRIWDYATEWNRENAAGTGAPADQGKLFAAGVSGEPASGTGRGTGVGTPREVPEEELGATDFNFGANVKDVHAENTAKVAKMMADKKAAMQKGLGKGLKKK